MKELSESEKRMTRRTARISRIPLQPPRGVRFLNGTLFWDFPQDMTGVTHFRVYNEPGHIVIREVPSGQRVIEDNMQADLISVCSYNKPMDQESIHVPLDINLAGVDRARLRVQGDIEATKRLGDPCQLFMHLGVRAAKLEGGYLLYLGHNIYYDETQNLWISGCDGTSNGWDAISLAYGNPSRIRFHGGNSNGGTPRTYTTEEFLGTTYFDIALATGLTGVYGSLSALQGIAIGLEMVDGAPQKPGVGYRLDIAEGFVRIAGENGRLGIGGDPDAGLDVFNQSKFRAPVAIPYTDAGRAMISDSTNMLVASSITDTQLGHLSGASENIQAAITDLRSRVVALESGTAMHHHGGGSYVTVLGDSVIGTSGDPIP